MSTVHRIDCRASSKKYFASGQFFFWTANHRLAQWYPTSNIVWDCVGTIDFRRSTSATTVAPGRAPALQAERPHG